MRTPSGTDSQTALGASLPGVPWFRDHFLLVAVALAILVTGGNMLVDPAVLDGDGWNYSWYLAFLTPVLVPLALVRRHARAAAERGRDLSLGHGDP